MPPRPVRGYLAFPPDGDMKAMPPHPPAVRLKKIIIINRGEAAKLLCDFRAAVEAP